MLYYPELFILTIKDSVLVHRMMLIKISLVLEPKHKQIAFLELRLAQTVAQQYVRKHACKVEVLGITNWKSQKWKNNSKLRMHKNKANKS